MLNRVIVAGSRNINDYDFVVNAIKSFNVKIDELVCGMAKGPDMLAHRWAKENNIKITEFYPDWDKHGKAAGIIRNREMMKYADALLAIWDGKSRGTDNMVYQMNHAKKYVSVVIYT